MRLADVVDATGRESDAADLLLVEAGALGLAPDGQHAALARHLAEGPRLPRPLLKSVRQRLGRKVTIIRLSPGRPESDLPKKGS